MTHEDMNTIWSEVVTYKQSCLTSRVLIGRCHVGSRSIRTSEALRAILMDKNSISVNFQFFEKIQRIGNTEKQILGILKLFTH